MTTCIMCEGVGERQYSCEVCRETGKWEDPETFVVETCPLCNGKGVYVSLCSWCNGTGEEPIKRGIA
jgi:DnaJ-class molecular chaperone